MNIWLVKDSKITFSCRQLLKFHNFFLSRDFFHIIIFSCGGLGQNFQACSTTYNSRSFIPFTLEGSPISCCKTSLVMFSLNWKEGCNILLFKLETYSRAVQMEVVNDPYKLARLVIQVQNYSACMDI